MSEKISAIDIETENTGSDVKKDNKRILSIQLFDGRSEEIYYADSLDQSLEDGKNRIRSLQNSGYIFVGYNIMRFDIPVLKQFLNLEIPISNFIDISDMNKVNEIKRKIGKWNLEAVCKEAGVPCTHKKLFEPIIERLKLHPKIIEQAKIDGLKLANRNNTSVQFSREKALNSICFGSAILQAYKEFVDSKGSHDSIFYQYAIGDVLSEFELFQKLQEITK